MTRPNVPVTTTPTGPAGSEQTCMSLFREAASRGYTMQDFHRLLAAAASPNRRAAYCRWLATEDRPAVRRGLLAGLAAMEVA